MTGVVFIDSKERQLWRCGLTDCCYFGRLQSLPTAGSRSNEKSKESQLLLSLLLSMLRDQKESQLGCLCCGLISASKVASESANLGQLYLLFSSLPILVLSLLSILTNFFQLHAWPWQNLSSRFSRTSTRYRTRVQQLFSIQWVAKPLNKLILFIFYNLRFIRPEPKSTSAVIFQIATDMQQNIERRQRQRSLTATQPNKYD